MNKLIIAIYIIASASLTSCAKEEVGNYYKGWQKGELEIHHIATGCGESSFIILPDGTSMLIDAGDYHPIDYKEKSIAKPNSTRLAGEWIARYIERTNPYKNEVDYLLVSHFHNDHIGDMTRAINTSSEGGFKIAGVNEVGQYIKFDKIIDRAYPDYNYPLQIKDNDVEEYKKYTLWAQNKYGSVMEKFIVGKHNQIRMTKNIHGFDDLINIRNLCANAELWTGEGENTIRYYDANSQNIEGWQNENTMSVGLLISYGPFKYYTGGDLSGKVLDANGEDIQIEEKVAKLCTPVDVCKANHHGYLDAMTEGFVKNIKATAYILPVWDYYHINDVTMQRMASEELYSGDRKIFATDIQDSIKTNFEGASWMQSLAQEDGHIVVKVDKGGEKYRIYILSNDDENGEIKAIYGPYQSQSKDVYMIDKL